GAIHGLAINVGDSFFNAGNGGSATISNNEISGFQRVGIFVVGTGASATASNNTITGIGPTSTTIQLGISFQDGAASPVGSISGNTITDVVWTGDPSTTAVAIFLWDSANDISITNNTVWDSQTGIMVQAAEGIQISGNNISTPVGSKGIWLLGRGSTSTSCVGGDDVTPGLGCTTSATVADNTLIGAGAGYGVAIGQTPEVSTITWAPTTATLICNDVSGWDIGIRIGPASPANTVAAHFNNISGNATAGLLNANSSAVDAKNNWWGAADGPSGDGSGSGDAVLNTGTGSVDFDPWLKSPLTCDGKAVTICGTSGNDVLTGTLGPDVIHGFGGNDNISGGGGNDTICGGTGNDTINCGSGSDRLFGQGGSDALNGGPGNDRLVGGGGKDMLNGEAGNDVLLGGSSDDMLNGGTGTDKCDGGAHVGGDTATNCETVKNVP
ncbi:MAG: right-handed parallel beta-helix repeat-containing protein, partial [Deltaproteobacteria bacterium]|nr:right-handed parallel beta-helix repeat-containing protein [Deltaproteobacteria bacterium]